MQIKSTGRALTLTLIGLACATSAQARGPDASKSSLTVVELGYFDDGLQQPDATNQFYNNESLGLSLQWGLTAYVSGVASDNANFGADESIGGNPVNVDNSWWENSALPVLRGQYQLPDKRGQIFAGTSAVYNMTRGSAYGDNSGSTPNHPETIRLDQAYVGWKSGDMFADTLGKDALKIAGGRLDFAFGDGFLVGDGFFDTGAKGGYYNGVSEAFENAGVVSLVTHGLRADLFYLEQDQYRPRADDHTSSYGTNLSYRWRERAQFGFAYLKTYKSTVAALDGTDIYNIRAKGKPIGALPNLSIGGQLVYEYNPENQINDKGWFVEGSYKAKSLFLKPQLIYRRAEFTTNYNTVFYDWGGGWGNWYMGEVVGEYMLFNSNLDVDMIKTKFNFTKNLNGGAIAYRFSYHNAQQSQGITDRNFANELDFYANWTVNKHLIVQGVYGFAVPNDGATQSYPDEDNADQISQVAAAFFTIKF
tara:strand:+ start:803 stop:2233 length:1431 start_codon:yes stop_codon:yes gene_type:complete